MRYAVFGFYYYTADNGSRTRLPQLGKLMFYR